MLYIDPNLHNPQINGIPLLVNNRINPDIAISKEDIVGGNGIIVDKYPDGTIRISANVSGTTTSDGDKYTNVWDIDFMSELPSVYFKYLNPLFDEAEVELFFVRDFSAANATIDLSPAYGYQRDENDDQKVYQDKEYVYLDYSVSTVVNNDTVEFSCEFNHDIGHAYFLNIYSSNNEQILSTCFSEDNYTVWLSKFPSGVYEWEVYAFNIYSMEIYTKKTGQFSLENNVQYLAVAAPQNMSSNEDSNWLISCSSILNSSNDAYVAFNVSSASNHNHFHTASSPKPHWISWKYKHGKVLIGKIEITSSAYDTAWNDALTKMSFEGSDDGVNWTRINTLESSYPNVATTRTFVLNNSRPFQWHRLVSLADSTYMTISFIKATKE